ncbi:MAG: nitrous oxide-stimulated promoter family protein [Elusimicrobia bacterium]|nr:nitrous oxide-stimulated promoter family protein [Elusimicrobiota bacterium]
MSASSPRLEREFETLTVMVELHCLSAHGTAAPPCPDCRSLLDYARARLDRCPFGADKPTCAKCPIHCYRPAERELVRRIMRFSGPRMLWRHPLLALLHVLDGLREPPKKRPKPG